MPFPTQAKLLRVLEDSKVRRLGGKSEMTVDVRVVAATNKPLEETIKKAFATNGPVIMEFKIAREEKVLPMVPAGASLNEMVLNA